MDLVIAGDDDIKALCAKVLVEPTLWRQCARIARAFPKDEGATDAARYRRFVDSLKAGGDPRSVSTLLATIVLDRTDHGLLQRICLEAIDAQALDVHELCVMWEQSNGGRLGAARRALMIAAVMCQAPAVFAKTCYPTYSSTEWPVPLNYHLPRLGIPKGAGEPGSQSIRAVAIALTARRTSPLVHCARVNWAAAHGMSTHLLVAGLLALTAGGRNAGLSYGVEELLDGLSPALLQGTKDCLNAFPARHFQDGTQSARLSAQMEGRILGRTALKQASAPSAMMMAP